MTSTTPAEPARSAFVRAYTIVLLCTAVLVVGVGVFESFAIPRLEARGETWIADLLRIDRAIAFLLAPMALMTALGRRRGRPWSRPMTAVTSVAMALIVPVGTAVFLYWLIRVRPREASSSA